MAAIKKPLLYGIAVFAAAFTVYLLTLCPSVYTGDSAELITAACNAGIAHPPGYPLYVATGKLFTFIPAGSKACRVNLMSAFFAALTAMLVFFIVSGGREESPIPGIAAGLALAFAPAFWAQGVVSEVFSMNCFFLALLVLLMKKYSTSTGGQKKRYAYLASYIMGLGLTNQQTLLFVLPGFIWFIISGREKGEDLIPFILRMAGFIALGLSLYLFLFIRSRSAPLVNWDRPDTVKRFLRVVLRSGYGTFRLAETGGGQLLIKELLAKVYLFVSMLSGEFRLAGILAVITGVLKVKRERLGILLLILFLLGGGFVFLANSAADEAGQEVMKRFFLMPMVIMSILLGFGIKALFKSAGTARKTMGIIVLVLLVIMPAGRNFYASNRSNNNLTDNYGRNILDTLEEDAILFVEKWDETVFILAYLNLVEKYRPDVKLYDCHASLLENIYGEDYIYLRGSERDRRRKKVEEGIIKSTDRPVYYAASGNRTSTGLELAPEGIIYRLKQEGGRNPVDYNDIYNLEGVYDDWVYREYRVKILMLAYPVFLTKYYLYHGDRAKAARELETLSDGSTEKGVYYELGTEFLKHKMPGEALTAYGRAVELDKNFLEVYCNMGVAYENMKEFENAEESYKKAIAIKPDYAEAHYNLGVVYWKKGNWGEVVKELEKVLEINPGHNNARKYLNLAVEKKRLGNK